MTVVADTPDGLVVIAGDALPLWTPRYGAFMEQSGRNQWQPWQVRGSRKPLRQGETVAVGCHRLPIGPHGEEGVDGSSPSEAFRSRCKWAASSLSLPLSATRGRTQVALPLVSGRFASDPSLRDEGSVDAARAPARWSGRSEADVRGSRLLAVVSEAAA